MNFSAAGRAPQSNCMPPSSDCTPTCPDCPFIEVPPSTISVAKNTVSTLTWKLTEVDDERWHIRIVTEEFTFHEHPSQHHSIPVKHRYEYNTTVCRETALSTENVTVITVKLWMLINDNVLNNVPYIACKVHRSHKRTVISKLTHLVLKAETTSTTEIQPEFSEIDKTVKTWARKPSSDSVLSVYTTSNAISIILSHLAYLLTVFLVYGELCMDCIL